MSEKQVTEIIKRAVPMLEAIQRAKAQERERCAKAICWFCRGDYRIWEQKALRSGYEWRHKRPDRDISSYCVASAIWNLEDGK